MSVEPFATTVRILEAGYYSDAELALWFQSPQPLLDNKTPLELLAEGRKFDLLQRVQEMDDGVYL